MIESEPFYPSFPNKITLTPGESFSRTSRYSAVAIPSNLLRITFDGKYTIDQSSFAKHRNPRDIKNYIINEGKWHVTLTYTFTNEDYEIAKQQKKNP